MAGRTEPLALRQSFLFGLAPGGVYLAERVTPLAGELLPHRFTLTARVASSGGLLSAALALILRSVGVTDHPVLRSPDFPLAAFTASDRLVHSVLLAYPIK